MNDMEKNSIEESIGSRIIATVYNAKKISERIFGYIHYDINFVVATYEGETLRPAKITPIEEGIVGILWVDRYASLEEIGKILGLDVIHDLAERSILNEAIEKLKNYKAIEGDDSCIVLTNSGRDYAAKGERPETYCKKFTLYIDTRHPSWLNIKDGVDDINIKTTKTSCDDLNFDLEKIRSYAEYSVSVYLDNKVSVFM